jgi:nitrite reductase (NADH) small subunit
MTNQVERAADPSAELSTYTVVCRLEDIEVEGGVVALVGGEAVAVFRTYDDELCALSNWDPFSHASVLSRGIVGTRSGVAYVASPIYKQGFDLRTGQCLDDETVRIPTYDVTLIEGQVLVGGRREHSREGP